MKFSKRIALLAWALFSVSTKAYTPDYGCTHRDHEVEPPTLNIEEEFLPAQGRNLATINYPQMRIMADYSNIKQGTSEFKNYVEGELMPAVIDYFQAAFKIKSPVTGSLKITSSTVCGYSNPSSLSRGVTTDYFLVVASTSDSNSNWVASAGACYLASGTKRPIIGSMLFNLHYTKAAKGDPLVHEKNMYLTMHEMLHALGFSGSSFRNFIDGNGKTLTGHIKSVVLDGSTRTVLDVEPLTSKLRKHYGCSTLPGAFLENDGGSGTAGSHFERRHFLYEAMTSGVIQGLRLSEFSLAVMEGSGWYVPDYSYADPFFVGQGQGCGFLYTSCSSSSITNYNDFCGKTGARGCAIVGVSGGVCQADSRSDGCQYYIPIEQYHCENPDATAFARLASRESYGRTIESRCFDGSLSTSKTATDTSLCFRYKCIGSGLSTTLRVYFGNGYFTCKSASTVTISGYSGNFKCPDPLTFCSTVGQQECPRKCMGRGTCVGNQCVCNKGYTGIDCAMNE